jgi:hypothetical protein
MSGASDEADQNGTRIGEWADLVGDEVPDRARRERVLRSPGFRLDDDDEWSTTAR